jgi:hypothetical protein
MINPADVIEPWPGGGRLTIRLTMFARGNIMQPLRTVLLALLPILAMTAETAPAGSQGPGCGVQAIDPGVRAALERFERTQSAGAAKVCALYLNNADQRTG